MSRDRSFWILLIGSGGSLIEVDLLVLSIMTDGSCSVSNDALTLENGCFTCFRTENLPPAGVLEYRVVPCETGSVMFMKFTFGDGYGLTWE